MSIFKRTKIKLTKLTIIYKSIGKEVKFKSYLHGVRNSFTVYAAFWNTWTEELEQYVQPSCGCRGKPVVAGMCLDIEVEMVYIGVTV